MKIKLVYSVVALFVVCNQSAIAAEEEQSDISAKDVKPLIVLGYKPIISFYHPVPFTLGQLIPAGSPWPDSPEGYRTTPRPEPPPSLVNKIGKEEVEPVTVSEYLWMKPSSPASTQKLSQNKTTTVMEYTATKPPYISQSSTILSETPPWPTSTTGNGTKVKPATVLEYKPTRPSFLPEPLTIGQLIPSGTPWPDSPQGYSTTLKPPLGNRFETDENKSTQEKPTTVLEYKPTRPPHLPDPPTIGQLIPSGTPWPESPEGYETTLNDTATKVKPATVLEYKPTRPSFLPEPLTIGQLIPSGTPWPDSPQGYSTTIKPPLENRFETDDNNSTQEKPATVLEYKPTRPSFLPEPSTIGQLIPSGTPWPDSPDGYSTTLKPSLENEFGMDNKEPATVLEYKPTRPSFLPEPVTIGQLIPPGKPWPASVDEYNTSSSQITNGFPEVTSNKPTIQSTQSTSSKSSSETTHIVLGYKPQRPWYVPDPVTVAQIIPPGKPWPASVDEYNTSTSPSQITNRLPEVTSKKPTIQLTQSTSSKSSSGTTHIVLGYKPQRPWYVPDPVTVGQIIPTGKPWPASAEGYSDFSAGKPANNFRNRDKNVTNSLP